mgnify:CR=1 FL=1
MTLTERCYELCDVLKEFHWANGPDGHSWGVHPDDEHPGKATLFLEARIQNSFDPMQQTLFRFNFEVDPDVPAIDQLRSAIHWFICHEADENIWYKQERVFNPHL